MSEGEPVQHPFGGPSQRSQEDMSEREVAFYSRDQPAESEKRAPSMLSQVGLRVDTASLPHTLDQKEPISPTIECPAFEQSARGLYINQIQKVWLRWCTAYRLLLSLAIVLNAILLIVLAYDGIPNESVLLATAINLLIAVLIRQEDLINASFSLVARTPSTLPLVVRKIIADFHHYGGVHIGCAISSLIWYCFFVIQNTMIFIHRSRQGAVTAFLWVDVLTSYAFMLLIALMCITAHPRLRAKFHNTFEHTHRFGGWASLVVLWVNTGISSLVASSSRRLYQSPALWLLAATTAIIILPWLRMRRVPITAELVSNREVKLTFPYANMPYTSTTRFSCTPLADWHAFATIPCADSNSAQIIISRAGDWTSSLIANPPSHLYIRTPTAKNFLAFTPLFNSVLLVATGAGIGPMLSLLKSPIIAQMQAQGKAVRVMWCVHGADAPHWAFVQDTIRSVDPQPQIFDSRIFKPDIAFEAKYMMHRCGLEAVMVVSNVQVTQNVVREVKAVGGAAYGAVFDS